MTITNNTLEHNTTEYDGAGAFLYTYTWPSYTADVTLTQNLITSNVAGIGGAGGTTAFGGGIYGTTYGYGTERINILNNQIILNSATGYGGGVWAGIDTFEEADHELTIDGNTIN